MSLRNLAIWNKKNNELDNVNVNSFQSFHNEIDRLFDGFFSDFGRMPSLFSGDRVGAFSPKIDISNDKSAIDVVAELPGLDEKDIQVSLKDNVLTIKGEKKMSDEKKEKNYHRVERSFGSFERSIRVPEGINVEEIKASFKNGVLSVSLPKSEKAKEEARKIEVKAA
jgi:HSP20 family protein